MCVITDGGETPIALAGVMGGLNSEIDETTTDVLLESATSRPATSPARAATSTS
jgi:phenylalanyl-tRNA synthetase beta chain